MQDFYYFTPRTNTEYLWCEFVISFDGPGEVEEYDPDKYKDMYYGAEGRSPQDRINYMRRQQYAVNKDYINTQKRAAYVKGKSIDNNGGDKYNNSPVQNDELKRRYNRDVAAGWISALSGFDNYKALYYKIENEVVGLETKTGLTIKSQSEHFLARVIGSSVDQNRVPKGVYKITGSNPQGYRSVARAGVEIEDIREAILDGRPDSIKIGPNGLRSQRFKGKKCIVTINPDTGKLIQCNLRGQ